MTHIRRRFKSLAIPTITFILGIFVQVWFGQWLTSENLLSVSIIAVLVSLVVIFLILIQTEGKFDRIDSQQMTILESIGVDIDFVEEHDDGKSYIKLAELVHNAKFSIICVANWEPFPSYEANKISLTSGNSKIVKARKKFYEVLKKKLEAHRNDDHLFHHRIVQVSEEYMKNTIPFNRDPVFFDYLLYTANLIESKSHAYILQKTASFVQLPFILIDEEYVIIPVLTTIKHVLEARYGALFIYNKRLAQTLLTIYLDLQKRAEAIKLDDLNL